MFSSEQLYITGHIWKTHGTKIILSCIESYFTLSGGSRYCYRRMINIIVCWKVISCCVVRKFLQNIGTLSNKQHHITQDIGWLPNYINTRIYNLGSNGHTKCPFKCFSDWANVVYKYI